MIRLRLPFLLLAILCADNASGGVARFEGFQPRQKVVVVAVPNPPAEPAAKLPPPTVHMEKHVPLGEVKRDAAPTAQEEQDARIKAERKRLNENALAFQRERAAAGSATAQRSLAVRYLTGDGVEKDELKGMDLLRKAAAGGDSAAQKELAKREPAKKEEL